MSIFDRPEEAPNLPLQQLKQDPASGEQRIVTLAKHLFREMMEDKGLDGALARGVRIRDYVDWCKEHHHWHSNDEKRLELKNGLQLAPEDIEAFWDILQDPYDAVNLLTRIWYMLALSAQPPIAAGHLPDFLHVAITFGFHTDSAKQKALQIQIPTRWKPGSPMTNGFLCALLQDQLDSMIRIIAINGMDALYEQHAVEVGETVVARKPIPPDQRTGQAFGF